MNPVRSGLRAVLGQPAVIAGEIAWRWAFGAAAWGLIFLTLRHILANVDVSEAEYYLARRSEILLFADACARVLIQVLPRLARAALVLVPALTLFWIVAATLGRAATLRALVAGPTLSLAFADAQGIQRERPGWGTQLTRLLALTALRALFTLATVTAFCGTLILISRLWPQPANPALAVLIWLLLALLVGLCWSVVNWFLGLAPIIVVRDGRGVWAAINDVITFHRQGPGSYTATVFWFGFLRTAALLAAVVLALFAAAASSPRAGVVLSAAIALIYFAIADFLYIARLAAFLAVAAAPAEPPVETGVER